MRTTRAACHVEDDEGVCHVEDDEGVCYVEDDKGVCHVKDDKGVCHVKDDEGMCHVKDDKGGVPCRGRQGRRATSRTRKCRRHGSHMPACSYLAPCMHVRRMRGAFHSGSSNVDHVLIIYKFYPFYTYQTV